MTAIEPQVLKVCAKCGGHFDSKKKCLPCKRAYQNAWNAAKGDRLKEEARVAYRRRIDYYTAYRRQERLLPEYQLKRAARTKVRTEIRAGRLVRLPCEICGNPKTDGHHHDHSKPLDVRWLCRRCHFTEEKTLSRALLSGASCP